MKTHITLRSRKQLTSLRRQLPNSKAELLVGLLTGLALVQLEEDQDNSARETIIRGWVEQLLSEGRAVATEWKEHPQLKKPYRVISHKPLPPNSFVRI